MVVMRGWCYGLGVLVWLWPLAVLGQQATQLGYDFVHPNRKQVYVSFRLVHNLMVIPVQINQSDTLNFIFDSGVRTPVLFGLPPGSEIYLNEARRLQLEGYGQGIKVEAIISQRNRMTVAGELANPHQNVLVIPGDLLQLSQYMGMPIHGIIGHDLYASFAVKTHYPYRRLIFYRRGAFRQPKGRWERLPVRLINRKPYIEAEIVQENGDTLQTTLVMDTGASFSLTLLRELNERIVPAASAFYSFLGRGMTGEIYGMTGRIASIRLGRYTLNQPVVNYPDSISSARVLTDRNRDGNLGSGIFSRFHLIVHYEDSCIYLKPNKDFRRPFRQNMSGMEVITPEPGVPIYQVAHVDSLSAAGLAGLRKGDQIHAVNGFLTAQMKLPELLDRLWAKAGRKIRLVVYRGEEQFEKIVFRIQPPALIESE